DFLSSADRSGVALPLGLMTSYLAAALEAPVPPSVLESLWAMGTMSELTTREEVILAARLGSRERIGRLLQRISNMRLRGRVLRVLLLPGRTALRWLYPNVALPLIPTLYAWRVILHLHGRMRPAAATGEEDVELIAKT